ALTPSSILAAAPDHRVVVKISCPERNKVTGMSNSPCLAPQCTAFTERQSAPFLPQKPSKRALTLLVDSVSSEAMARTAQIAPECAVSLTAIVPATNRPATLQQCLNAIAQATDGPEQVVVVDDP